MKRWFFHPAARKELRVAIAFYEVRREGLGEEFLDEVEATIRRICDMPATWPKLSEHVRRAQTRRFPYGILYRELRQRIEIIAVLHLHRHPDTWMGR
ncbi:type II toxin-antitoxin system RelE/ParE family toxin [Polyangium spumosum]|uniref:Type II toxin-antitoxin system RelE/ParE family toxin n=1 Tax=Polyangium spumosum TaxID=889282 RepID=A0A6N7Q025_9BACT|nr:type II toxin-antitoxin system RelE/ParE family toxin [Polyangium spumosum]MRG96080.1 type II toxin-antitoxin system RelE/ParE family toxin [Polyangium spumosum]